MALGDRWVYRLVLTKTSPTCQHHPQSRPPTRRPLLHLEGSPAPREVVFCVNGFRKLLELLQKIVKEEYSGDADCELWMVVLSGAKDSVTDDI